MIKTWTPLVHSKSWILFWADSRNYALVRKKDVPRLEHPKTQGTITRLIEGWYFPIYPAIKALLYREMEEKVLEKPAYKKAHLLLLDLKKALDEAAKEITGGYQNEEL